MEKKSKWEFQNIEHMLDLLAGTIPDMSSQDRLALLELDRKKKALHLIEEFHLNNSMSVLELGSGCGLSSKYIAKKVNRLYCTDISQSFLDFAEKSSGELTNISYHKIKSAKLSFCPDEQIDFIFSMSVFIHLNIYDIYWYLKEAFRVLKPNGIMTFDIIDSDRFDLARFPKFIEMAEFYRASPDNLETLLTFHSVATIQKMATSLGLVLFKPPQEEMLKTRLFYKRI